MMRKQKQTFGSPSGLRIEITWKSASRGKTAADLTRGELLLWAGEKLTWGLASETLAQHPVEWTWIEMLEHLSFAWKYIEFEQGYPLGLRPVWPVDLQKDAEARWEGMPQSLARSEEPELHAYIETHDLRWAVKGADLPSVYLVRLGNVMTIGTATNTLWRPLAETLNTLTAFGEAVCDRIAPLSKADPRAAAAILDWKHRRELKQSEFLGIATGWEPESLSQMGCGDTSPDPLPSERFEITERIALAGAARGHLGAKAIKDIFAQVERFPKVPTPQLDKLSTQAVAFLDHMRDQRAYEQGQNLADWLRRTIGIEAGSLPVEDTLKQWNVAFDDIRLPAIALDAVACWGPRHGPVIVLNNNAKHDLPAARRMTLSHEICHLLVDRQGALPLGEVLNGNMPRWFEQRADAFAAGLLLPRGVAGRIAREIPDTDALIATLTKQYEVSREVAAWQVRNSNVALSGEQYAALRSLVSHPERF